MNDTIGELVMTRGAMSKRDTDKDFISISYTARKRKHDSIEVNSRAVKQTGISSQPTYLSSSSREIGLKDNRRQQDVQMKRARYDVIKFGSSGFVGAKKEEAKIALAVKLGAKLPKNKGKNYKELRLERQKAKEFSQKEVRMSEIGKTMNKRRIDKRSRKQPQLLSSYGVVKNVSNYKNKKRQ